MLKIYNDEPVDFTNYDGGSLSASRGPGNGLVVASGPNPDNETYTVTLKPGAGTWKALGLEVVQDEGLPGMRVARGADELVITEIEAEASGAACCHSSAAMANLNQQAPSICRPEPSMAIPKTGWAIATTTRVPKVIAGAAFRAAGARRGPISVITVTHPPGFRLAARHHGPLPAGAFAERILVAASPTKGKRFRTRC